MAFAPELFFETYGQYILIAVVTLFALFAISRSYLRLREGEEGVFEFLFWTGLWTVVMIIAFMPKITQWPARVLGINRGVDVLVYFGLIFLFYSVYRIYAKMEKMEQEITQLTRAVALNKGRKKEQKTKKK